jgi:hypothetical protein
MILPIIFWGFSVFEEVFEENQIPKCISGFLGGQVEALSG